MQKVKKMARGYNNLAGFCRDLRAATLAAAEGGEEETKLLNALDDALGLFDAYVDGDLGSGEDSDAYASGDEPLAEDDASAGRSIAEVQRPGVRGVGDMGQGPTLHSTRARMRQAARPKVGRPTDLVAVPSGTARPVPGARAGNGGKR